MKKVFDVKTFEGAFVARVLAETPIKAKQQVELFLKRLGRTFPLAEPVEVKPTPEGVVAYAAA